MNRLPNQPRSLNETPENRNDLLRKENVTLNQELHQLKKISGNSKLLISQIEWHKSQLNRAKSVVLNYKQYVLKIIKKKDLLLKTYEAIVYGKYLPKEGNTPVLSIIDGLKTDILDL